MSGVLLQRQRQRVAVLRDLLRRRLGRRVVGHGGRHDDDVHPIGCAPGRPDASRRRCGRGPASRTGGRLDRGRSGDERHVGAAPRRFGGDREAHAAARSVADVAHRVDVFVGRAGGDEHALAAQRTVAARAPPRPPRRSRPAPRAVPCRSSRTPDSPRPARRTARRAPPACRGCARTASCANIWVFIAGATSTGARVAMYSVDRKSSAMPLANLPMMLAVAGATSSRSIVDASAMCSMSALAPGAN